MTEQELYEECAQSVWDAAKRDMGLACEMLTEAEDSAIRAVIVAAEDVDYRGAWDSSKFDALGRAIWKIIRDYHTKLVEIEKERRIYEMAESAEIDELDRADQEHEALKYRKVM